jgi:hypothetical protein
MPEMKYSAASAVTTLAPPIRTGTPAATSVPKARISMITANGKAYFSAFLTSSLLACSRSW